MKLNPGQEFFMARAISPVYLPRNMCLYYLIINKGVETGWGSSLKYQLKSWLVKWLLSITEVIAHW